MQQPQQMMPSFSSPSISTEQIQKYLDENKKLIVAIMDNQNLGKLAECAQFQAQLQKNLMYLAAIADSQPQPQTPPMPPQMTPPPGMQQGGYYMPHPQAHQQGIFPSKMPKQFNSPHQVLGQIAPTRPVAPNKTTTSEGGGNVGRPSTEGNKQDSSENAK